MEGPLNIKIKNVPVIIKQLKKVLIMFLHLLHHSKVFSASLCKLHSLGIVKSTNQLDNQHTSNTNDYNSSNADPNLLISEAFCSSSGTQKEEIVKCGIQNSRVME